MVRYVDTGFCAVAPVAVWQSSPSGQDTLQSNSRAEAFQRLSTPRVDMIAPTIAALMRQTMDMLRNHSYDLSDDAIRRVPATEESVRTATDTNKS